MISEVRFYNEQYGNVYDHYFRTDYSEFIKTLEATTPVFVSNVNLGKIDGIKINNKFEGDFSKVNCAVINHDFYRIVGKKFIRLNLWSVELVLDIVSARWDKIINSSILVKKLGLQRNIFNPLLMTQEKFTFNKVKTNQLDLTENSHKSWGYMIYCANGSFDTPKTIPVDNGTILDYDYAINSEITSYNYYNALNEKASLISWEQFVRYHVNTTSTGNFVFRYYGDANGNVGYELVESLAGDTRPTIDVYLNGGSYPNQKYIADRLHEIILQKTLTGYYNINIFNASELEGKVIKSSYNDAQGVTHTSYYENKVTNAGTEDRDRYDINKPSQDELNSIFKPYIPEISSPYYNKVTFTYTKKMLVQNKIENGSFEASIGPFNRSVDQPYICLFIPFINNGTVDGSAMNKEEIENFLYALAAAGSGANGYVYDIQLVPYCPISGIIGKDNTNITSDNIPVNKNVVTTRDGKFVIIEVKYTQFTLSIDCPISISDYKVDAQKSYQLTSASGNSCYELSVVMNGGIDNFFISCTYRPFASTIRIQPNFKNMYGDNYNDTRGLIIKEDTSLTLVSSEWATYVRQNINYLQSFNVGQDYQRSVLTINQKADWVNYGYNAGMGALNTAVAATGAGLMAGPVGAVATVAAGAIEEGIQAGQLASEQKINQDLLNEKLEQDRQQFNYNLGNIKALPQNLGKTTGLTSIYNYVPYIQVFEPTPMEKDIYEAYLNDNGCEIGCELVPSKLMSFNFIQGSIVKSPFAWDAIEYKTVCDLLNQGVRLFKEEVYE